MLPLSFMRTFCYFGRFFRLQVRYMEENELVYLNTSITLVLMEQTMTPMNVVLKTVF